MSSNTVTWTNQTDLVQLPPPEVLSMLETTKGWVDKADEVLSFIEGILKIAQVFISPSGDLVINFIKRYSDSATTVLRDLLTIGGGAIVITPYNRMGRREIRILPEPWPLILPGMTPAEAFQEFYASFDNKNDINRPRWSANTEVAGMGFLLIAPDPVGLSQLATSLSVLFSFNEFSSMISKYSTTCSDWAASVKKEDKRVKEFSIPFDIEGFPKMDTQVYMDGVTVVRNLVVQDSNFAGKLHWYGLGMSNFPWFDKMLTILEDLLSSLLSMISTTTNTIIALISALVKKIRDLKALITTVYNVIKGILVGLSNQGLYYFSVPKGVGGVDYIKSSLALSLSNPQSDAAKKVASAMNNSPWSSLMFMGVSTGFDINAWQSMFQKAWDGTIADVNKLRKLINPQFVVSPDLTRRLPKNGTVETLRVLSTESTNDNPHYFEYILRDSGGAIKGKYKNSGATPDPSWAKVNTTGLDLTIPKFPDSKEGALDSCTLEVRVVDKNNVEVFTTTPTAVTNKGGVSLSGTMLTDTNKTIDISISSGYGNGTDTGSESTTVGFTAKIIDSNGRVIESVHGNDSTMVSIGMGVTEGMTDVTLVISMNGEDSRISIQNYLGVQLGAIDKFPIPNTVKFGFYPAGLDIDLSKYGVLAIKYKNLSINGSWVYKALPGIIDLEANTGYEYWLFVVNETYPNGEWTGPYYFSTVDKVITGTLICG